MKDRALTAAFKFKDLVYKQLGSEELLIPVTEEQVTAMAKDGIMPPDEILSNLDYAIKGHDRGQSVYPGITEDNIDAYKQFTSTLLVYEYRRTTRDMPDDHKRIKFLKDLFEEYSAHVPAFSSLMNRGMVHMQAGEFGEAMHLFNCAANLYPDSPDAFFNRGAARGQMGDMDGAESDLNHSITLAPDNAILYKNRALFRAQRNNIDGAISDYCTVIKLDPDDPATYYNRGTLYFHAKQQVNEALEDFKKCARMDPANDGALCQIGIIMQSQNQLPSALGAFNLAVSIKPDSVRAYAGRGVTYMMLGQKAKADQDFAKARELDPEFEAPEAV